MLNFLINEGKNDLPKLLEFTTTQENFTKMSDAMSKKKKSDITKEENEKYNALVKEYNTGVKTFNELINRTNNERAKNLNAWNNKVSDFLGKHAG
jgi:Skp family chaperone for outer membrane proteins